jgi:HEPN domain-containing protein
MKRPLETAKRWLAQAEHSLTVSNLMFENDLWSEVCFNAEQTAILTFKAFLFSRGRRFVYIHSISELASECAKEDTDFARFQEEGKVLDGYYIPTRYPDALPEPAVPYESFTQEQAHDALVISGEMVELIRVKIPQEQQNG